MNRIVIVLARPIRLTLGAVVGCLAAINCGPAIAVELWYDGFSLTTQGGDYDVSLALGGQSGGSGSFFSGPWVQPGGDDTTLSSDSLSVSGGRPTVGGSATDSLLFGCCYTARTTKAFTTPWDGFTNPTGTYYMGFLANFGSGNPIDPHFRSIEMYDGGWDDGIQRNLQLGYSSFGNFNDPINGPAGANLELSLAVRDATITLPNSPNGVEIHEQLAEHIPFATYAATGHTHHVVLRFDLGNEFVGDPDRVRVYLDPMDYTEPAVASADLTVGSLLLDRMSAMDQFTFAGEQVAAASFDELRVGTSFFDVRCVPEPGTGALLLIGSALATVFMARQW